MNKVPLWNPDRIGTAIVGHYRCGTHFLNNAIRNIVPLAQSKLEIDDVDVIKSEKKSQWYQIAILNHHTTKMKLLSDRNNILQHWHVIKLTRRDKVSHFISNWFWSLNTQEQQWSNSGKFSHHGTSNEVYIKEKPQDLPYVDPGMVMTWLQEQMVNDYLRYDYCIDYEDLPAYATPRVQWNPNQYGNITLKDLVCNHEELSEILSDYVAEPFVIKH
jgi:hypothetical protein